MLCGMCDVLEWYAYKSKCCIQSSVCRAAYRGRKFFVASLTSFIFGFAAAGSSVILSLVVKVASGFGIFNLGSQSDVESFIKLFVVAFVLVCIGNPVELGVPIRL